MNHIEYRFRFGLDLGVGDVFLGRIEDLEAVALISTTESGKYWFIDGWSAIGPDGGRVDIPRWGPVHPIVDILRAAIESEWLSAAHKAEVTRQLRADPDDDDVAFAVSNLVSAEAR